MRNDGIYRRRLLRPKKPGKLHHARRRAKQNLNLKRRFEGEKEASVLAGFTATPEIKNINKNEKPLTPFHLRLNRRSSSTLLRAHVGVSQSSSEGRAVVEHVGQSVKAP